MEGSRKNKIKKQCNLDGSWREKREEMEHLAVNFFKDLYTAENQTDPGKVTHLFESIISDETNSELCREFSEQEISNALFRLGPLKHLTVFRHVFSNVTGEL